MGRFTPVGPDSSSSRSYTPSKGKGKGEEQEDHQPPAPPTTVAKRWGGKTGSSANDKDNNAGTISENIPDWASGAGLNKRQEEVVEELVDEHRKVKGKSYVCSSCGEAQNFSDICPLFPKWLNWQSDFVQICFECAMCRSGPKGPQAALRGEDAQRSSAIPADGH